MTADSFARLATALARSYRIERELGRGGMATVYLARDLKHDREVALKVLRPELAAVIGAERFLAEIKTTAHLQHPHILPLFDSGQVMVEPPECSQPPQSFLYYVMPFVEGESLRHRLIREQQLPVPEAIRIATEVASALDYAHRHQIVHRDIKPENILLHERQALVADFGVALAVSSTGDARLTETGISVGTPLYMSPEQAVGQRAVSAQSDIYALGAVTYEMLIGEPPFTGPTAQAIVAKVMATDPAALVPRRRTIPPHVEAAVLRSLEKLPADRFDSAAEFAAALANPGFSRGLVTGRADASQRASARLRGAIAPWLPWALALLVGLWAWVRGSPTPEPVRRYVLELADLEAVTSQVVIANTMAISRDGSLLAYVGGAADGSSQIWVRDRDQLHGRPIPGTPRASSLAWSPDSRQLAYVDAGTPTSGLVFRGSLRVVSLDGSPPVTVIDSLVVPGGTVWGPDGYLYTSGGYTSSVGIVRAPATGGKPVVITVIDTASHAFAHLNPAILPNNRGLLFSIWYGPTRDAETDIALLDFKTGRFRILQRGIRARYLVTGHLLIARANGSLAAVPFDPDRMETTGPAVTVITGLAIPYGAIVDYDVSETGSLIYFAGEPRDIREQVEAVWVTRDGRSSLVDSGWTFQRPFNGGFSLSPDGRRLALAIAGEKTADIWIKQLDRGPLSRLTSEEFLKYRPIWKPDGSAVTYLSDPGDNNASILQKRIDGNGSAEHLLSSDRSLAEALWSPDGRWLVVRTTLPSRDILLFRPGADSAPMPIVAGPQFEERAPTLAPGGRWIAYQSDESGRSEIYVRPFPRAEGGRWQISTMGGEEPLWSHSGREIFFRAVSGDLMAVPVTVTSEFSAGAPRTLFPAKEYARSLSYRAYDVTPDDRRFLFLRPVTASALNPVTQVVVVDNWFGELHAKMRSP